MTELRPLAYEDVLYVAQNMRQADKDEIYATRWNDSAEQLAADAMLVPQMCWTACKDNRPVAAFGAIPIHPGVWTVWMFSTNEWPSVSLLVTRHIIKKMMPSIKTGSKTFKRGECKSHSLHHVAHRWLEYLGASKESIAYKYGKNGENFFVFAWL